MRYRTVPLDEAPERDAAGSPIFVGERADGSQCLCVLVEDRTPSDRDRDWIARELGDVEPLWPAGIVTHPAHVAWQHGENVKAARIVQWQAATQLDDE